MAKKAPPSFDFYPEDWLTSPRVLGMLPEQEGAYIHLLAIIGNTESCCIAGDERSLASSSRLHTRWKRLGGAVRDCFMACPEHPDRITNEKLWDIRQRRLTYSQKQGQSGTKGANRRWGKDGKPYLQASRVAIDLPSDLPPNGAKNDGDHDGESIARSLLSSQEDSNRHTQKHRVRPSEPPGGAVDSPDDGQEFDPDPDGTLSLTLEQQRRVNDLRELTGETDRAALYRQIVARLGDHVFMVISELRVAVNDRRHPVENPGALFVKIAKRIAAERGIVLFRRRAA